MIHSAAKSWDASLQGMASKLLSLDTGYSEKRPDTNTTDYDYYGNSSYERLVDFKPSSISFLVKQRKYEFDVHKFLKEHILFGRDGRQIAGALRGSWENRSRAVAHMDAIIPRLASRLASWLSRIAKCSSSYDIGCSTDG